MPSSGWFCAEPIGIQGHSARPDLFSRPPFNAAVGRRGSPAGVSKLMRSPRIERTQDTRMDRATVGYGTRPVAGAYRSCDGAGWAARTRNRPGFRRTAQPTEPPDRRLQRPDLRRPGFTASSDVIGEHRRYRRTKGRITTISADDRPTCPVLSWNGSTALS
jgi:hypothetical protein